MVGNILFTATLLIAALRALELLNRTVLTSIYFDISVVSAFLVIGVHMLFEAYETHRYTTLLNRMEYFIIMKCLKGKNEDAADDATSGEDDNKETLSQNSEDEPDDDGEETLSQNSEDAHEDDGEETLSQNSEDAHEDAEAASGASGEEEEGEETLSQHLENGTNDNEDDNEDAEAVSGASGEEEEGEETLSQHLENGTNDNEDAEAVSGASGEEETLPQHLENFRSDDTDVDVESEDGENRDALITTLLRNRLNRRDENEVGMQGGGTEL